ncbi:Tyrosine recombinase XerC [Clostridium felsineum]|uniref:Tyrosine recombinase XerC n=1 Tax=Clostridium felsineum TaxID=36839 RepID=A0A1S8LYL1_9CLOT|nr:Tyrosine recombinase XerC [Clostridium felsineum]URZ12585.1 Tyrosine recombinase XerC [Clostridium felsineum]
MIRINYVEPIRDRSKVEDIAATLRKQSERNYIMFILGIYSGLRVSDILRLKVKDVKNRDYINIREKKTRKQRVFPINNLVKRELKKYCEDMDLNSYLIKSRQGCNKPLSRETAYLIIRRAGEENGIVNLGTHSMRKTFGYHFYMQYKDIVTLQKIFNHSDPSVTLHYIGVEQGYINSKIKNFKI